MPITTGAIGSPWLLKLSSDFRDRFKAKVQIEVDHDIWIGGVHHSDGRSNNRGTIKAGVRLANGRYPNILAPVASIRLGEFDGETVNIVGLCAAHAYGCDIGMCTRLSHLYITTQQGNSRDRSMVRFGRLRRERMYRKALLPALMDGAGLRPGRRPGEILILRKKSETISPLDFDR